MSNDTGANSTDTIVHDYPEIVAISSGLSAIGDLLIIISVLCSPSSRQVFTVRLIFFLAIADLLGQMPVIGSYPVNSLTGNNGFWCSLSAAGNWFSALSSWLWTMMYAFAVHKCFKSAGVEQGNEAWELGKYLELERYFHIICWGLPLVLVCLAAFSGQYGHGYAGGEKSTCGFIGPNWALAYESVLWIALLYNVYSFAAVNALIRAALRMGTADMDPQARRELEARVRLWPRFMLYVGSFLGSQAPCALRTIFDVADAPESVFPVLNLLACVLCPLHGFLNGLVYGCTTRRIRAIWLQPVCCGRGCCTEGRFTSDSRAPLVDERTTDESMTRLSSTVF